MANAMGRIVMKNIPINNNVFWRIFLSFLNLMMNIITNGIKIKNHSYLIILNNANVKNDIKITEYRLLRNRNNENVPSKI